MKTRRVSAVWSLLLTLALLTTAAWGVVWGVGWGTAADFGMELGDLGNPGNLAGLTIGAIIGLTSGLILRRAEPVIQWPAVLILTLGWAIAGVIGGGYSLAAWMGGIFGGLATGWVVRRTGLPPQRMLTVALGWTIGWIAGSGVMPGIYSAAWDIPDTSTFISGLAAGVISGVLAGAVGSGVMFWQLSRAHRNP